MATVSEMETLLERKTKAELIQFITDLINREESIIALRDRSISKLKTLLEEYKQKLKEIEAPKLLQEEEI